MSRHLFQNRNSFGLDIVSLNIQRGRDHALRPYNDYRVHEGRMTHFTQFPHNIGAKLSKVYDHPEDIDLWVGGLLEAAVPGGIVGTTFANIIGDQFSRFRKGDRFFHEHSPLINSGAFGVHQLEDIRKITLTRIICDNMDHTELKWIVPHAFLLPDGLQ